MEKPVHGGPSVVRSFKEHPEFTAITGHGEEHGQTVYSFVVGSTRLSSTFLPGVMSTMSLLPVRFIPVDEYTLLLDKLKDFYSVVLPEYEILVMVKVGFLSKVEV